MNINKIKKFYKVFREKMLKILSEAFENKLDAEKYVKCYNALLYNYTGIENYVTLKNNNPDIYNGQVSLSEELLHMFKAFENKDLLLFIDEKFKNNKKMKEIIENVPIVNPRKIKKEINTVCYYVMLEAIMVISKRNPKAFSD